MALIIVGESWEGASLPMLFYMSLWADIENLPPPPVVF